MITKRKANLITRLADDKEFWTIIIYDSSVLLSNSESLSVSASGKYKHGHVTEQLTEKLVFVLGCGMSDEENVELIKKYTNVQNSKKELRNVKEYWDKQKEQE